MKVIAYYLPQFHPTPENDEWWGKGFTEWTNVAKAKPLFRGHHQPHLPADLGFYDLRLPESRKAQADMAREFGVTAFCYWHYWFGKGRKLLNLPFEEVVRLKEPDFPFCLAWANHSWYNKQWTSQGKGYISVVNTKTLIEQRYEGEDDYKAHFTDLLPAFTDERYLRVHGRLLFVLFDPDGFTDFKLFKQIWNDMAAEAGLPGFYFVGHDLKGTNDPTVYIEKGFDAVNLSLHTKPFNLFRKKSWLRAVIENHLSTGPTKVDYKKAIRDMDSQLYERDYVYPSIVPNWDHTPRSGRFGRLFTNCTPELFREHVRLTANRIKHKQEEDQLAFLKSWNEWGEGNYLEPDLEWGRQFGDALRAELDSL